jgi:hypothetical protein
MRIPERTFRKVTHLLLGLTISAAFAACGGGGGGSTGSTSPGVAGPATLDVSIAAADATGPSASAVTVSGSGSVPTTDPPEYQWAEQLDPRIAHVYMDVVKVSLMPAAESADDGSIDGDFTNGSSPDPAPPGDKSNFITLVPDHPIPIDLLNLKNGKKFARFLKKFDQIPAGTYDKIRVYYRNVRVVLNDLNATEVRFHPTANSKFDIHFRQGHELVIPPVTTDTTQIPDGWVKLYSVKLDVVGLKLMIVGEKKDWEKAKVILRPQIFAEFLPPVLYSVAGTASGVPTPPGAPPFSGTFNVSFGTGPGYPRVIPVAFNNDTTWAYSDNVLGDSLLVPSWTVEDVPNTTAVPAFRDRAEVMAIGPFDTSSLAFQATDIVFTFPDVREGKADNVWIPPDNTAFIVQSLTDNVTVFPQPNRSDAYYDNLISPHNPLDNTYLDNNLRVRARGYFENPEASNLILQSYWISIGDIDISGP